LNYVWNSVLIWGTLPQLRTRIMGALNLDYISIFRFQLSLSCVYLELLCLLVCEVYVPMLVWGILLLFCRTRWALYQYFSHVLMLFKLGMCIWRLSSLVLLLRFSRCLHLLPIWSLPVSVIYCSWYWLWLECSHSISYKSVIYPALHLDTLEILCVLDSYLLTEFLVLCLHFYFLGGKNTFLFY